MTKPLKPRAGEWEKEFDDSFTLNSALGKKYNGYLCSEEEHIGKVKSFIHSLLTHREQEVRGKIAKEIETVVETVLGYIGDETEELAAKNRWKTLKPKWMNQAVRKSTTY